VKLLSPTSRTSLELILWFPCLRFLAPMFRCHTTGHKSTLHNLSCIFGLTSFLKCFSKIPFNLLNFLTQIRVLILGGSLVTTAWRILGLRMEETPSKYGR
jgi:uncharacterized membrane protein YoaK (UPF0700 family)